MSPRQRNRFTIHSLAILLVVLLPFAAIAQGATDMVGERREQPETKQISMRFKDASLDSVLEFFAGATGYTVVKDAELSVRVTVMSPGPIAVDEAVTVLNSILSIKGYTSILNGQTLKIVALDHAKQDGVPIQVGSDPDSIASEETVVTQVMPLSFADATQLVKDLKELMPDYGVMVAHARTNTLIITASSAAIKRFAEIVKNLDFSVSNLIQVQVFQLKYAVATDVAELINKLYEKSRSTSQAEEQQRNRARGFFGGGGPFGGGGRGRGDNADAGNATPEASGDNDVLEALGEVRAVADENLNAVVVSASKQNLTVIEDLLEQLDQQTVAEPVTRVFTLNNGDATDVASELNQAFSRTARNTFQTTGFGPGRFFGRGGPQQQQEQGNTTGEGVLGLPELVAVPDTRTNSVVVTTTTTQIANVERLIEQLDRDIADFAEDTKIYMLEYADAANVAQVLNQLLANDLNEQRNTRTGGRGQAIGFGGFASQGGSLGSSASNAEEARGLTGNVKIVADSMTNALLVTTFTRNFPIIEKLIESLDVLLPQVLIEAQIIEVTLNDESLFGVEWMWERAGQLGETKVDRNADTSFGLTDEAFGLRYGVLSDNLDALLMALTKDTSVNILSTPRIMTQNNEQAVINVGQELPFLQSTQETATGGILTSYDFRDVGVILTVTPRINRSGTVSLDVNQQINSLVEFTLFNAPVIAVREATAYVTVRDGQTMIIGGIIKDDKTQTVNKVPILGDIPLIGKLFQRSDTRVEKTELMVFITPHVVFTEQDAQRVTKEQQSMLRLNRTRQEHHSDGSTTGNTTANTRLNR